MGIYDRDYYREQQQPGHVIRGPRTVIGWLILINVAIYLIDSLLLPRLVTVVSDVNDPTQYILSTQSGWIEHHLAARVGEIDNPQWNVDVTRGRGKWSRADYHSVGQPLGSTLTHPWLWWQFLTSGFVHSPSLGHILCNMLLLFLFGRPVEARYGPWEFLRIYLAILVVTSVTWCVMNRLWAGGGVSYMLVGASGAVTGTVILFAWNYPRQTVLFMFFIPMPAWLLGVILVASDAFGWTGWSESQQNVAYCVHLTGAAFASLYFYFGWNLGRLVPSGFRLDRLKPRPRLRVHDPDQPKSRDADLIEEVDRILAKIHRDGEASLTRKERRVLQNASRQYQKKRQEPSDRNT